MAAPADRSPWVIVAGGLHPNGGMDRANYALATYLLNRGTPLHLVAHEIDSTLVRQPLVSAHPVARPRGMPALAERLLARAGMQTAERVRREAAAARVVVNGGSCPWPDINWVHAVHAAWPVSDEGAPWWGRARNRRLKAIARRRERQALSRARIVVANSESTRSALLEHLSLRPERVRTVYLGSDRSWGPADAAERCAARARFGLRQDTPVVAFVGALGLDVNKGFDLLWDAWKGLAAGRWDAQLLVAGGGWRLPRWRREVTRQDADVHFLGFTPEVRDVLAAADLLVSPVRYESYGLNVHEALCRGLAVMVSRTAGVAERFDAAMAEALLPEQTTAAVLASRLSAWRNDVEGWRARAGATAARIRARSWDDMAGEFVRLVDGARTGLPA
jgi:glycosyltransferase involved in cell wall biosynthesis